MRNDSTGTRQRGGNLPNRAGSPVRHQVVDAEALGQQPLATEAQNSGRSWQRSGPDAQNPTGSTLGEKGQLL